MKEGVLSLSDTDLADLTVERWVKASHRSQVTGAGQLGEGLRRQEVAHYGGVWMSVCVEAQGAPEGRAPGDNIQVLTYKGHTCQTKFSTMQPFIWQLCTEESRIMQTLA